MGVEDGWEGELTLRDFEGRYGRRTMFVVFSVVDRDIPTLRIQRIRHILSLDRGTTRLISTSKERPRRIHVEPKSLIRLPAPPQLALGLT